MIEEPIIRENPERQSNQVEKEVAMIVDSDAVVDPWAVAAVNVSSGRAQCKG
jgi:hypothetical protein